MGSKLRSFLGGSIIDAEWHRVPAHARHRRALAQQCGSGSSGCTTTPSNNCCSSTQVASQSGCCGSGN
jgi:hypothetical protein